MKAGVAIHGTPMRIDPALVAFDIDGVIADTMRLFMDIARDEYRIDGIAYEDFQCYNLEACLDLAPDVIDAIIERILNGDYRATLRPYTGAAEVLNRIAHQRNPLLLVTARPYPGPIQDWINELLPDIPGSVEIVTTGTFEGKADVLMQHGIRYFVEDRLQTCFYVREHGVEPVLYRQPWNREAHPFVEVKDWRELEALIDF
jgi:hypothetical protein